MKDSLWAYLGIPVVAWLVAQLVKLVLTSKKGEKHAITVLFRSGNMPSSHSAGVTALLMVLAQTQGIDSPLFGIAAVFGVIVIYDSLYVRRAVGEQGKVLKALVNKAADTKFFTAEGHRLPEVVVGCLIGIVVALLMLQIL